MVIYRDYIGVKKGHMGVISGSSSALQRHIMGIFAHGLGFLGQGLSKPRPADDALNLK